MNAAITPPPFTCLIIDDDAGFAGMISQAVRDHGGDPVHCASLASARAAIANHPFDLILLDHRLPDGAGFEFHAELVRHCPAGVVVMITGAPELAHAIELTRNGLFDYLTKPLAAEDFVACLERAKRRLARPERGTDAYEWIGSSHAMTEALQVLRQMSRHAGATVLLLGETGTGKDLAARLLHRWTYPSRTSAAPYVALNCSAVPSEMFEAELFGSERGAYTGADKRRVGLVEAADGGTLFLDEVTETPLLLQAKLLRFLESREYRLLGSAETRHFTGRVVAATNRVLADQVRQGRFREDLLYRLDVNAIRLPCLRECLADIPALAETLLAQLCEKYQRRRPLLRPADLEALCRYSFPGNVRELRNLIERSLLRAADEVTWLNLDLGWLSQLTPATIAVPRVGLRTPSPLQDQEYILIQQALREEGGAIRRTAARLGLTHQALLRRLQKWPELREGLRSSSPGSSSS